MSLPDVPITLWYARVARKVEGREVVSDEGPYWTFAELRKAHPSAAFWHVSKPLDEWVVKAWELHKKQRKGRR